VQLPPDPVVCSCYVLLAWLSPGHVQRRKASPAEPQDLAESIAFALLFSGRKRVHDSDKYMAAIVADRVVRHLERAGFVVMKRPPVGGGGDNPGRTGTPGR
jgi:hypothetical protein